MTGPVHSQPTAHVSEQRRAKATRGADLCRARPAVWSAIVRYSDGLQRDGMSREEADDLAWATYLPEQADRPPDGQS